MRVGGIGEDTANEAWLRTIVTSLEPLRVGYYVGESDLTIAPDRARQCFSPLAWDKLTQLKRKYDPDDVFFSYLQQTEPMPRRLPPNHALHQSA